MDYNKIMSSYDAHKIRQDFDFLDNERFPEIYESIISKIIDSAGTDDYTQTKLKERRAMGLKKYGLDSFQATIENAIASPTVRHIEEELFDCLNYLAHEHFKASFLYPRDITKIKNMIEEISQLILDLRQFGVNAEGTIEREYKK